MIVIGDIHGCYESLLALIEQFPKDEEICFVGDLIDRGPMSKQVVDFVKDNNYKCVKGNHEDMMATTILKNSDYLFMDTWYSHNGGGATIESYKLDPYKTIKDNIEESSLASHAKWMKELPTYLEFPEIVNDDGRMLVVSHSCISTIWDHPKDESFDLYALWNRETPKRHKDIFNIFGHTPQSKRPFVTSFCANVDTGCVYKNYRKHGILSAISYPSMKVYTQENIDA